MKPDRDWRHLPEWRHLVQSIDLIKSRFDTPCYVYNRRLIDNRLDQLQTLFKDHFSISYAVKANPNHRLLDVMRSGVSTYDVSSIGECKRVLAIGVPAKAVTFSGPAKRDKELKAAIALGVGEIVIESYDEARRIVRFCQAAGKVQKVLVRICPRKTPKQFGASMSGKSSQFGIEEDQLVEMLPGITAHKELSVQGFHIYSGSNCLSVDALEENFRIMIESFSRAAKHAGIEPKRLIFGAGFGVPYTREQSELDLNLLAGRVNRLMQEFRTRRQFKQTHCSLELGRWIVGPAGVLLTSVVSGKTSNSRNIRLCDAGFNNHLAAFGLLGAVIRRNWRIENLTSQSGEKETYNLAGPLCTTLDVLAQDIELPLTGQGDVLAIGMSGAYGLTASPVGFISHPVPKELMIESGGIVDISEGRSDHGESMVATSTDSVWESAEGTA